MDEYIKRDTILKYIENLCNKAGNDDMRFPLNWAERHIKEMPSDVIESVRGYWFYNDNHNNFFCSVCHCNEYGISNEDGTVSFNNFCPNCGADMRGEKPMADVIKTNVMDDILHLAHLIDNISPEEVGVMLHLVEIFFLKSSKHDHILGCDRYCGAMESCEECDIKNLCVILMHLRHSLRALHYYLDSKGETE